MIRKQPGNLRLERLTVGLLTIGAILATTQVAIARSSGGRSSGGSFSSPSRSSSSPSRSSSSPSRSSSSPSRSSPSQSRPPSYSEPNRSGNWDRPYAVPVPVPQYPSGGGYYPNSGGGYYPNSGSTDFNRNNNRDQMPVLSNTDSVGGAILDDAVIDQVPPTSAEDFTKKAMTPAVLPSAAPTLSAPAAINDNRSSGPPAWLLLPVGGAIVGGAALILTNQKKAKIAAAVPGSSSEIHNDILTISTVQVALLANSPIQQQLSEIVETMEIETPAQLKEQLQAVVIALLRLTEYWSHAKVASQTFPDRTQAESFFSQGSMQERAKLSEETLTRDSFGLREKAIILPEGEDPAAYVVVTLRLGTTHDRPLFETVHTAEELKLIFDRLAGMTTPELLTFELIWSPQESSDSLSRDELLTEYSDLVMV